jgi:hypothetical protein
MIIAQYWNKQIIPTPIRDGASESAHIDSLLPGNHPTLFMGSLQQAIAHAKDSYKFLAVYLHSELHQDTPNFVEKVFCDQTIIDVLNRNFVVWAGDVSLPGPHVVSLQLPIDGFPALCVFAPVTFVPRSHMAVVNEAHVQLPLQLYKLGDTCNNTNLDDVLHMLVGIVDQYSGWITAVRRNVREAAANRQLLEEQDNAYQQSLRMDEARAEAEAVEERQREVEERLELERVVQEMEMEQRRVEQEQLEQERAREELTASREAAVQRLGSEPSSDGPDVISVTFRTIESSRIMRRFNKTDTVEMLYNFCRTINSTPNQFSLATPYPRRTLSNMEQTLGELNINKAILTIEPM